MALFRTYAHEKTKRPIVDMESFVFARYVKVGRVKIRSYCHFVHQGTKWQPDLSSVFTRIGAVAPNPSPKARDV